jgi:hypothetical protein
MTSFPPSLGRARGKSDAELEEKQILRQLRRAVNSLDSRSDTPDPEEAAQYNSPKRKGPRKGRN